MRTEPSHYVYSVSPEQEERAYTYIGVTTLFITLMRNVFIVGNVYVRKSAGLAIYCWTTGFLRFVRFIEKGTMREELLFVFLGLLGTVSAG